MAVTTQATPSARAARATTPTMRGTLVGACALLVLWRPVAAGAQGYAPPPPAPLPLAVAPLAVKGPYDSTIRLEVSNRIRGEFVDWFATPPDGPTPNYRYNFLGNKFQLGVRVTRGSVRAVRPVPGLDARQHPRQRRRRRRRSTTPTPSAACRTAPSCATPGSAPSACSTGRALVPRRPPALQRRARRAGDGAEPQVDPAQPASRSG